MAILGTGGLSHWPAMPESGRIGLDFDRRFLDAFLGGRIETFLRYPREALEAEAGPGGHEIRTWITVAAAAGDARGSLLVVSAGSGLVHRAAPLRRSTRAESGHAPDRLTPRSEGPVRDAC